MPIPPTSPGADRVLIVRDVNGLAAAAQLRPVRIQETLVQLGHVKREGTIEHEKHVPLVQVVADLVPRGHQAPDQCLGGG